MGYTQCDVIITLCTVFSQTRRLPGTSVSRDDEVALRDVSRWATSVRQTCYSPSRFLTIRLVTLSPCWAV